jgi:dihydropteroate synthase
MEPALRISSGQALTVTFSGLTADQTARIRNLLLASVPPDWPGFDLSQPDAISIHGTPRQLKHCTERLAAEAPLPGPFRAAIAARLDNYLRRDYRVAAGGRVLDVGAGSRIMGILNVTPDSFSDGGLFADAGRAVEHARQMAAAGAGIIDVGGESTRPGAEPLGEEEELRRIIPVIGRIAAELPTLVSVDTYKSAVARAALKAGASIVNDISGLRFSPDMARVAADHGAAVVIMHIKGTPRDMQANPVYTDVIGEIMRYLEEGIEIALRAGVGRDSIMIDPGIGFGKTLEHNLTILARLDELRCLGCPIVLGTSRKRFIGAVLEAPEPKERTFGTAATVALGIQRGACILRLHDVAEMAQVARMTDAIVRQSRNPNF